MTATTTDSTRLSDDSSGCTHDLIVIGSGSGNSVITDEMDDWRVALVEPGLLGGTCLNVGCIPTKMFVYTADRAHAAATSERFGVHTTFESADWPAIRDRIFGRIDPIAESGRAYRESNPNVDLVREYGHFVGDHRLAVGDRVISAPQIVLAAGAHAVVPDLPGLAEVEHHTSDTIMRIDDLPEHLLVIGGGYVGVELAHVFGALGSRVTMVVRGPALLRDEDPEVSRRLTAIYHDRFDLRLATDVVAVHRDGTDIVLDTRGPDGAAKIRGDCLLVATGRRPNSGPLAVEATGVAVDDAGYVVVDAHQRTSVEGIWALGDIASPQQLKHKANADARLIVHNLLHPDDLRSSTLGPVPHAVFGSPQVASIGMTEPQAEAAGREVATAVQEFGDAAYGWAMEDTTSAVKLVVDPTSRLLLGAHIIGPQAPTLLQPLVQGMQFGQTVDQLARGQWWIHPALTEVVEQAMLAV